MKKVKKLRILRNYLKMTPNIHDQLIWGKSTSAEVTACGTTLCMAGATALLFGLPCRWVKDEGNGYFYLRGLDGTGDELADLSAGFFGLTYEEKTRLFYDTSNDTALEYLDYLCDGKD